MAMIKSPGAITTSIKITKDVNSQINELVKERKAAGDTTKAYGKSSVMAELVNIGLATLQEVEMNLRW